MLSFPHFPMIPRATVRLLFVSLVSCFTHHAAAAPTISQQPVSISVTTGQQAQLSVTATGTAPVTYQWQRNGFPLTGKTGAILTIIPVALSDADSYNVVVTDGSGSTASQPARISVAPTVYPQALRLDPSFDLPAENENAGNFNAAIAYGATGQFIGVGDFTHINGNAALRVARFHADGSREVGFAPIVDNAIFSVAVDGAKILIGGTFAIVNGVARTRLARLNADGSLDPTFAIGSGPSNTVRAIARQADGKYLIGGNLTSYNGTGNARNFIVRVNADGSFDSTFNAAITGTQVNAIVVQPDGKILIGGTFTQAGTTTVANLVRVESTGAVDPSFAIGTGLGGGAVNAIAIDGTTSPGPRVIVGGAFTNYNTSTTVNRLARLSTAGVLDSAFNSGTSGPNNIVNAVVLDGPGVTPKIYIAGTFTSYSTLTAANRAARINDNGTFDVGYAVGGTATALVYTPASAGGAAADTIVVAGSFTTTGSLSKALARFAGAGTRDSTVAPTTRGVASVNLIRPVAGGKWLVGGSFTHLGGVRTGAVARLTSALTVDSTFNAVSGSAGAGYTSNPTISFTNGGATTTAAATATTTASGQIATILVTHGGAGYTSAPTVNITGGGGTGAAATAIVSGGVVKAVVFPTGANSNVNAAVIQGDGRIVIAGNFSAYDGTPMSRIARLEVDGTLDPTYINAGPNSTINALAGLPSGKLIVGGGFATYFGLAQPSVVRVNADGTVDSAGFNAGTAAFAASALAVQPDGKVVVGGSFTRVKPGPDGVAGNGDDVTQANIIRLEANGALDNTFGTTAGVGTGGANPIVNSVQIQPTDNKIVISGNYTTYNGGASTRATRLNADGSPDNTFNAGTSANGVVSSVLRQEDGKYLFFGSFSSFAGQSNTASLARVAADGTFDSTFANLGHNTASATTPSALQVMDDGKVLIGVNTLTSAGRPRLGLARLTAIGSVTIASLSTTHARPGSTITITGTEFIDVTAVRFNGSAGKLAASYTVNSPTSITVTVPLGAVSGPIFVQTLYGTVTSSASVSVAPDFQISNPQTTASSFEAGLAFGNGIYVAATLSGTLWSSPDGIAWARRFAGTNGLNGLAFAAGQFTAVGGSGTVLTSTDGVSWFPRALGTTANLNGVTHDGTRWLAVSSNATVVTSTNGTDWTFFTSTGGGSANAVAFGAGVFVSAGGSGVIRTSGDGGFNWTAATSNAGTSNLLDVVFLNDQFIAVGTAGTVVTSPDGVTPWTARVSNAGATNLHSVTYQAATGKYLVGTAGGASGYLTSTDGGVTWTSFPLTNNTGNIRSVLFANNQFVGAGSTGNIFTSPDGTTWTPRQSVTARTMRDFAYGDGRYVAVSNSSAAFATSTDGVTWTAGTNAAGSGSSLNAVAYGNGIFVAVGGGLIATTTDGVNWINRSPTGTFTLLGVTYGGGVFVAVGNGGVAYRSLDGLTWTPVSTTGTASNLNGIAYGAGMFTAVGASGAVTTSADLGLTWTATTSGANSLNAVRFAQNQFIMVGASSTVLTSQTLSTPAALTLTSRTLPTGGQTLTGVAFGDGFYIAVGTTSSNTCFISTDAVTWAATTPPADAFNASGVVSIAYGNGRFLSGGFNGLIITTNPAPDTLRITTPPASSTIVAGNPASLSVTASTGATAYQWYHGYSGDTSTPVGTNSASFTTPALTASARYWVRVTGAGGVSVDSATALLLGPPTITTQPLSQTINDGSPVTFSVSAFGAGTLTYQWRKGTDLIPDATGSSYTISPATTASAGSYNVVVTGSAGSTPSNAATLTVTPVAPVLSQQISLGLGSIVQSHSTLDLQMFATGTPPISLQWKKNGVNFGSPQTLDGTGPAHIFIPSAQPSDMATYSAIGTNAVGTSSEVVTNNGQWIVDESNWTWRNPKLRVSGAAVMAGKFLVVGTRGFRATSTDGQNWTQLPSLAGGSLSGYVFGNNTHVIWGGGAVQTSPDAQHWTTGFVGNWEFPNEMTFGNGLFIAAYPTGRIITSPDAKTWTDRTATAPFTGDLGVVFGGGIFLVGNDTHLALSPDGINWSAPTAMPLPEPTAVRYLNGKFYFANNAGGLASSADGITWTVLVTGGTAELAGLAYANNRYVAVGDAGRIITSDNGVDWTTRTAPAAINLSNVVFANGTWLAAGANNSLFTSTDNGVTWTQPVTSVSTQQLNGVATDGAAHVVAVGNTGVILRSTDGATWTAPTSGTSSNLNDVT